MQFPRHFGQDLIEFLARWVSTRTIYVFSWNMVLQEAFLQHFTVLLRVRQVVESLLEGTGSISPPNMCELRHPEEDYKRVVRHETGL